MMKQINLMMAAMTLAGAAQAVELAKIRPFNVGSQVLSYRTVETRDGRFTPPRVIRRHFPMVISNEEAAKNYLKGNAVIKNVQIDQIWDGENADVQIQNPLNRNCLTVTGHPQTNGLALEWMPCQKKTDGLGFKRQVFFLRTNGNRASAFESSILDDLGFPHQQTKCVERLNATEVGLRDCAGLGNWSVTH